MSALCRTYILLLMGLVGGVWREGAGQVGVGDGHIAIALLGLSHIGCRGT